MSRMLPLRLQRFGNRWYLTNSEYGTVYSRTGYATRSEAQRVASMAGNPLVDEARAQRRVELGHSAFGIDGVD